MNAPKITLEYIESQIVSEHFFTASDGEIGKAYNPGKQSGDAPANSHPVACLNLLTFCVLVLKNGFMVTGESACVSPENFHAELGRSIAREHAIDKCWPLFGFELRSRLATQE